MSYEMMDKLENADYPYMRENRLFLFFIAFFIIVISIRMLPPVQPHDINKSIETIFYIILASMNIVYNNNEIKKIKGII